MALGVVVLAVEKLMLFTISLLESHQVAVCLLGGNYSSPIGRFTFRFINEQQLMVLTVTHYNTPGPHTQWEVIDGHLHGVLALVRENDSHSFGTLL